MAEASDEAEFVVKVIGDFTDLDAGMKARGLTGSGDATFAAPIGGAGGGSIGGMSSGGGLNSNRLIDSLETLTRAIQGFGGGTAGGSLSPAMARSRTPSSSDMGFAPDILAGLALGSAGSGLALWQRPKFTMPWQSPEGTAFGGMNSYANDEGPSGPIHTGGLEDDTTSASRIQRRRNAMSRREFRRQMRNGDDSMLGMDFGSMDSGATRDGRPDPLTASPKVSGGPSRRDVIDQRRKNNQNWRDDQQGRNEEWSDPKYDEAFNGPRAGMLSSVTGGKNMPWNKNLSYFGRFMAVEGIRTVTDFAAAGRQGNINDALAMGDQSANAMAALQFRTDIASSMPLGIGKLGQLIRDPLGAEELGVRIPLAQAGMQDAATLTRGAQIRGYTDTFREAGIAHTPVGAMRQLAQLNVERKRVADAAAAPARAASDAEGNIHRANLEALDQKFGVKDLPHGPEDDSDVEHMVRNMNDTLRAKPAYIAERNQINSAHGDMLKSIARTQQNTIDAGNSGIDAQTNDVQFGQLQRWQGLRVQERVSGLRATAFGNDRYTNERQAQAEEIIGNARSASREFHHQGDDVSAGLAHKIGMNQLKESQTRLLNSLQLGGTGFGQPFGPSNPNATDDITMGIKQFQNAAQKLHFDPTGAEAPGMFKDTQGSKSLQAEIVDGLHQILLKLTYLVAGD